VAFSADGQRVFGWDGGGKVLAWNAADGQPCEAANLPLALSDKTVTSPDRTVRAEVRGHFVVLLDLVDFDPQREYAERMILEATNRIPWHQQQAAQAEKDKDWFAAGFHLGQLLKDEPNDPDLFRRRNLALERLKPPTPMQPLPRP
jgi:hypothetical protein